MLPAGSVLRPMRYTINPFSEIRAGLKRITCRVNLGLLRGLWYFACALFACGVSAYSEAQSYPTKAIRFLVGYSPGGAVDTAARIISEKLATSLRQQFIIDNRPGAAGNLAAGLAATSAPDGYTLYMGTVVNTVSVSLYKKLAYDLVKDFDPVSLVVTAPSLLVVNRNFPAHDVKALVALAKTRSLTYASSGIGSSPHLSAALLSTLAGIHMTHVPYKGGLQVATDLISGQVDLSFSNVVNALTQVRAGRLRALAVTSRERIKPAPEIPTMIESGFPDFVHVSWYGVLVPRGVPVEITRRLSAEIARVLALQEVRNELAHQGLDAQASTPEELALRIKGDIMKYAKLLRSANVQAE